MEDNDLIEAKAAYQAYLAHHQENTKPLSAKDVALEGLDKAGRALDYAGGLARTGVTSALSLGKLYHEGDIDKAIRGQAPHMNEYLERMGVPEIAKVSDVAPSFYAPAGQGRFLHPEKGGMLDPSVRDVAGFAGDVALDPFTYLTAGLSNVAKKGAQSGLLKKLLLQSANGELTGAGKVAHAVLNPVENYAQGSAKRNYGKAFNYIDKQFPDNAHSVADLMRNEGFVGSASSAADRIRQINSTTGADIGNILEQATSKGASVNLDEALRPALEKAQKVRALGTTAAASVADQIENEVAHIKKSYTKVEQPMGTQLKVEPGAEQMQAPLFDPYHSVEQDRSRVLETRTPMINPELEGTTHGVAPNVPENTPAYIERKRNFIPLEQEPHMGQTELPFVESQKASQVPAAPIVTRQAPVSQANQTKAMLNDFINFNPSTQDAISNRARKAVAAPLSEGITRAVGETDKELLKQLLGKNKLYASTNREVQDVAEKFGNQVAQQRGLLDFTPIDAILGGAGAMSHTAAGGAPLAAKKTLNILNSTQGRTLRGAAAQKIYDSTLPKDAAAREVWKRILENSNE